MKNIFFNFYRKVVGLSAPFYVYGLFVLMVAFDVFLLEPTWSFGHYSDPDWVRLILIFCDGSLIVLIAHMLRKYKQIASDLLEKERETDLSYRAVIDLSPYMIWYANQNGELTWVNRTTSDYTGMPSGDHLGKGWAATLHPEDQSMVIDRWTHSIETMEQYAIEFRIRRFDGAYRWFEVKAKPIYDDHGQFNRWIGQCSDNHDRKMAILAYQNALFVRDRFMSLASHELRTPLTSIKLQMQIFNRQIKRKDISLLEFDHLSEVANMALKQVDQLEHLIEEMLDVSRISSGRMSFSFTDCNLDSLIRKSVSIVSSHYSNARVPLDLSVDPTLKVTCDENKISQVIINLLTNALKYGGGNPVQLVAKQEKDMAKIEVIDMGIGVPPEAQKKIFEPFERVDHKSPIAGLGLGLYISKEVVHAHKGRIGLVSRLKKGSKFIVEIPVTQNQMNFFERTI